MATNIKYYIKIATLIRNNIKTKTMKFTKSQRALHQPNYNPPCNVYQPQHILNSNKILTGSLAPPAFPIKNTFGYETRFNKEKIDVPGPGAYNTIQSNQKKDENLYCQSRVAKGKQYPIFGTVPSIPYSYYGQHIDEEENNYIQQLLLSQNISKASDHIKKKQPAFSFSKSQKNLSYIPIKNQIASNQNILQNQKQVDNCEQQTRKKNNLYWQQKIKKSNEKRLNFIQAIDPDFVPSLQLIEIIKKKTNKPYPGPGEYQRQKIVHSEFQIFQNVKGFSFTSTKRFNSDKMDLVGPGIYNPKKIENVKRFSFAKDSRNVFEERDETNFRFYINPDDNNNIGLHRQRASSCPFGSNSSRFPQKSERVNQNILTLQQQNKKIQNQNLNKIIRAKLKVKSRKTSETEKDEGLLGISTMASTIQ